MKFSNVNRLALTVTALAVGAFCPNLRADWGSLHGSNHSTPAPVSRPQMQPARAPVARPQPQPEVRPEPRPEPQTVREQPRPEAQPVREEPRQEVQPGRAVDRPDQRPVVVNRSPAAETDRRRMDIDQERRQSYFWSDYHAGMRVDRLPDGYRRFHLRDHDFFYFGGVYYDSGPSGYEVCAPPVDADIPELPPGAETIQVGDTVYYYAAGAFYVQQSDGSFVVVAAPLGVTVSLLPPDATSVVINGAGYFQADGTYYEPVMQDGVTAYLTVPQP
jgi:hypothetical protein